jgi:hypothetical protein
MANIWSIVQLLEHFSVLYTIRWRLGMHRLPPTPHATAVQAVQSNMVYQPREAFLVSTSIAARLINANR